MQFIRSISCRVHRLCPFLACALDITTWLTSNVKLIDVSHNNMRQPGQNGKAPPLVQALASFAPKYPNLASFKASHNKFHGAFEFEQISQNIDFSHNDISSFSAMNWGVTQTGE